MKRTRNQIAGRAEYLNVTYYSNWTNEELDILKYNYENISKQELNTLIPRHPWGAIVHKAKELGLSSSYNASWTNEMDSLLQEGKEVPKKTNTACLVRCRELNIYHPIYRPYTKHFWTEDEDNILKEYYPSEGCDVQKRLINRNGACCLARAKKLGVKYINQKDAIKAMANKTSKKIICIETGEIFNSVGEAQRKYNYKGDIGQCARDYTKGKDKTALGYHWKYIEE